VVTVVAGATVVPGLGSGVVGAGVVVTVVTNPVVPGVVVTVVAGVVVTVVGGAWVELPAAAEATSKAKENNILLQAILRRS